MPDHRERLLEKIALREAVVGVIGLGYAGLPLARAFAEGGLRVLGFDTDPAKVAALQAGTSYLRHIPDATVRRMQECGFEATGRLTRLGEPDALLLCVPTPLTGTREPDLSAVTASAQAVTPCLHHGQLIVLESTSYPGTTRQVVRPILEATGLRAGADFFLAFSPEREDPGNPAFPTAAIPKVVGGLDRASLDVAVALYARAVDRVVPLSGTDAAEACKVLENTYRAVNIALANELKVLFDRMDIDVWEVIAAAATKPFGFQPFFPSPGVGGECVPVDPFYLAWVARKYGLTTRFIELAGEVNAAMPEYVALKLAIALNDRGKAVRGSRVTLLGMAYKRDVDDCRESPGLALMDLLRRQGADVRYHDPYVPRLPATRRYPHLTGASQKLTTAYLAMQDAVVVVTDHSAYDWAWVLEHAPLVIDTRNATRGVLAHQDKVVRA